MPRIRDRITHFYFLRTFDVRRDVAGFADLQLFAHVRFWIETADLFHLDVFARVQQLHLHPCPQFPIKNPHVRNDPLVSIKIGIESERLHRRRAGRFWSGNPINNCLKNFVNANTFLGAG